MKSSQKQPTELPSIYLVNIINNINKFIRIPIIALTKSLMVLLSVLMALLTLSVIWQVASRYILRNPATWPDEIARFSMIWISIFGGTYVYALEKHLAVTLLPDYLRINKISNFYLLKILFHFLVIFLGIVMILGGYNVVSTNFNSGQLSAILHINVGYVYACVPISGILLIIFALIFIMRDLTLFLGFTPLDLLNPPSSNTESNV